MSEMQRVNAVLDSKGRRQAWVVALIVLFLASVALNVAMWWSAHERAMDAEAEAATLAQQVQAECEAGGTLSVDGADLCHKADDVAERTEGATAEPEPIPGPSGPPGPQGERGPMGLQGASIIGPQGEQGLQGVQGEIGPMGTQGIPGLTGPPGETGAAGPAGEAGPAGPQGEPGQQGPGGPAGAPGPICPEGYTLQKRLALTRDDEQAMPEWTETVLCIPTEGS